jgi:hypothetical protein
MKSQQRHEGLKAVIPTRRGIPLTSPPTWG